MEDSLTFLHALSHTSVPELKKIIKKYSPETKINPNAGKPKLIKDIVPIIPKAEYEKIIDRTFNTPKTRFTAYLGRFEADLISEDDIKKNCDTFNKDHDYDPEIPEYLTNNKENLKLVSYSQEAVIFYYSATTKKLEYDEDAMESKPVIYTKKIRILIKPNEKKVAIFTGDKDLMNNALTALTIVFGKAITPLMLNTTGISNIVKGSFSFHSVKAIDFIYHGLAEIGVIGAISQIIMETSSGSKRPQKVTVQGDDLLEDKSICEYLVLYSRDIIGVKMELKLIIGEEEHKINLDLGLRGSGVKIGIKKGNHPIDKINEFYNIIENNMHKNLKQMGLINEEGTIKILERIRQKALSS